MDFLTALEKVKEKHVSEMFYDIHMKKPEDKKNIKPDKPGILSKIFSKKKIETAAEAEKYYDKNGHVPDGWVRNIHGEFKKK